MEQGLTAKPFFPWIGGKEKLIPIICPIFPPGMPRYGEHFGGSGSILLSQPKIKGRTEIYNDYDADLSNLFTCVRDRLSELLMELKYLPLHSEAEFNAFRRALAHEGMPDFTEDEIAITKVLLTPEQYAAAAEILQGRTELWDVQRAAAFYTVDRRSFNGTRNAFAIRPTNLENFLGLMERASRRLKDVVITNRDFEASIKAIDSEDTLHYCDPPYFKTEKMYSPEFSVEDHYRLHDRLCECKGPRVISYNDCDFVRELYNDHYIMHFERRNSMSLKKDSIFEELLALEELDPGDPEDCFKALEIGCEFARTNAPDCQSAVFVQADSKGRDGRGGKLHVHVITNDVRMSDCKGIDPRAYAHFHFSRIVDGICGRYFTPARPELAPERVSPSVRGARLANEKIRAENAKEFRQALEEGRHPELKDEKYIWRDDLCERIRIAASGAYDLESFAQRLRLDGVELVPRRLKDGSYAYIHPATRTMPAHFVYELVDTGGFEPGRIPANLRARSHKLGANYQPEGVGKLFLKGLEAQAAREELRYRLLREVPEALKRPPSGEDGYGRMPSPPGKPARVPEKPEEAPPASPADPETERARQAAMDLARPLFARFMGWGDGWADRDVDERDGDTREGLWRDAWDRFKSWLSGRQKRLRENGERPALVLVRDRSSGKVYVNEKNLLEQFADFLRHLEAERQRREIEARREALEAELRRGTGKDRDYTDD